MEKESLAGLLARIKEYPITTFSDRLILHKTVYLLQEFLGIDFGYNYNYYVSGPYCPKLTQQFYELGGIDDSVAKRKFKNEEVEQKFSTFVEDFLGDKKDDRVWLELMASILFLAKWGHYSREQIIERMKNKIPSISNEEINSAIDYLVDWNLIPNPN